MPQLNLTPENPTQNFRPTKNPPQAQARLAGLPEPTLTVSKKEPKGKSTLVYSVRVGPDQRALGDLSLDETYIASADLGKGQNLTLSY